MIESGGLGVKPDLTHGDFLGHRMGHSTPNQHG